MKISACYIVKNEAKTIKKSLDSIKYAADEIIVVDTGSADNTKEVAASFGAKVFDFAWNDDFSAPRNFAIEKATGDCIIFLDADEYFAEPDAVRAAIVDIFQDSNTYAIMVKLIDIDDDDENNKISCSSVVRIFRNQSNLRYGGMIHEQLVNLNTPSQPLEYYTADDRLSLYHTGYSENISVAKARRNLRLLQHEEAVLGHSPKHDYYMAECYFAIQDYTRTIHHAIAALNSDFTVVGGAKKMYHYIIESMRALNFPLHSMLEVAKKAIAIYPDAPEFYAQLGFILLGLNDYIDAKIAFVAAINKYNAGNFLSTYVNPAIIARLKDKIARIDIILNEQAQESIKISACYIAKDEEKNLARSLGSIKAVADEIIVVDTGSVDNTAKIAEDFGAKVYSYKWQDDFSAARNAALNYATGDFIIFLDADEYFTAATAKNIRAVLAKIKDTAVNTVTVALDNIDTATGENLLSFNAPRIFRRGVRYRGKIHEEPYFAGENLNIVNTSRTELNIIHTGYSKNLLKAKGERNLALLKRELAHSENPERLYMYLAETYDGLGNIAMAGHYARLDIDSGVKSVAYASRSYRILLRLLVNGDKMERLNIAARAAGDFPSVPDFRAELAECYAAVYRYSEAVAAAEQAIALAKDYHGLEPMMLEADSLKLLESRIRNWDSLAGIAKNLKITAGVIVKNESKNIGAWLANAKAFADKIIVVDTGSTDDTINIAQNFGAEVYNTSWQGFAAARNEVLAKCEGDWAAVLDADETFYNPLSVRGYLASLIAKNIDFDALTIPISNVDALDNERELIRAPHIRLIRLNRGLKYVWPVHEQLRRADGTAPQLFTAADILLIRHTGYSADIITAKAERNLKLMLEDIKANGLKVGQSHFLAEAYYTLGDLENAYKYARLALTDGAAMSNADSSNYRMLINVMEKLKLPLTERLPVFQAAREKFPNLPDFPALLGLALWDEGDFAAAKNYLENSLALINNSDSEATTINRFIDEVYASLADIYYSDRDEEKSLAYTKRSLAVNKYNAVALDTYCQLNSDDKNLAYNLVTIVGESEPDLMYLARFADSYGYIDLLFNFAALLNDKFNVNLAETDFYKNITPQSAVTIKNSLVQNRAARESVAKELGRVKTLAARDLAQRLKILMEGVNGC